MKTVDILAVVDCFGYLLLVNVLRQWKLYDESVYIRVVVQFVNFLQKFFLCDIGLVTYER